jgi:hypothetical protein
VLYVAATGGVSIETYGWCNGRLQTVVIHHAPRRPDGSADTPFLHHTDELFYRADGRLERIEQSYPARGRMAPSRGIVFERRKDRIHRRF